MPHATVHVILNPTSANGRAGQQQDRIVRELRARGVAPTLHLTQSAGHATQLAKETAESGVDVIVAAGGDGTVHDVANGILRAHRPAALALLPLGTGNDFAKMIPGALHGRAYDTIAGGVVSACDVGHAAWPAGDEFFINGMGTGIDVEVVRQLHGLPALPGPVKYLLALFRALAVYDAIAVTAVHDDVRESRRIMMMAVGNGVSQGGGFYLTPDANAHDGVLDLCFIDELPIWKVALVLPRVLRGTHQGHPSVTMSRTQHVRFEPSGSGPLYFQLDGELREAAAGGWIDVTVKPGALRVVTGAETRT